MIPKIIHYCWFGGNELPEDAKRCIASWKRFCPNYKIIQWNESNYDVTKNRYMKDAYDAKKWAFVSDYARVDIINQNGGIYLDTDVELIKPLDSLLDVSMYAGWENRDVLQDQNDEKYENSVNFGLGYGSQANNPVLERLLNFYEHIHFYNEDGSMNLVACPHYQTQILKEFGLDDSKRTLQRLSGEIVIYPEDYFSPKSFLTGQIKCTENTISIHHFSLSWVSDVERKKQHIRQNLISRYGYRLGNILADIYGFGQRIRITRFNPLNRL